MRINQIKDALCSLHNVTRKESINRQKEISRINNDVNVYFYDSGYFGNLVVNAGIAELGKGESSLFTDLSKTKLKVNIFIETDDSQSKYEEYFFLFKINEDYMISTLDNEVGCMASDFSEWLFERIISKI